MGTDLGYSPSINAGIRDGRNGMRYLFDYAGRTDGQWVYQGIAPQPTAEGATTWLIHRATYDGSNRITDLQVQVGSWTGRATLGWT